LQINLATAFLASAVVGLFESTIATFTALAVLLPVVAGQSGNTGAQALAVTMRGLALREIRVSQWARVVRKETAVAFFNGWAGALTTA
ncbi:MAG: magnesium transporter, partial [Thermoanaerobaculia bacterium]